MQTDDPSLFLATAPADRREVHFALAAVLASTALFIAAFPFSTVKLAAIPAFIPAYESALIVCDLITAVLLFGQFRFLRLPGLLVLASGYLFTAAIALVHALTFPGVFSSTGLLGAGPQSTAWLYIIWHAGFPIFVIAYAALSPALRTSWTPAGWCGADRTVRSCSASQRSSFWFARPRSW